MVGPNGSSKSSLVKKIMTSAEDYSRTENGSLYTFSWVFPIENYVKGSLGLGQAQVEKHLHSFAHLEDSDINAILPSELKDHPLLLLPTKSRQKIIKKHIGSNEDLFAQIKQTYLYNGDLSKRNRLIFDALLKNYKGNIEQVLKHIRVERYYIEKRYSVGATTIEPQLHVDAKLQQITMDKRLASLSLQPAALSKLKASFGLNSTAFIL